VSPYALGVPDRNGETKEISVADLEPQSPRFAIIPQVNFPANDTKATAIHGCCKPIASLGFLGWGEQAS
jgi:hypothetical protein